MHSYKFMLNKSISLLLRNNNIAMNEIKRKFTVCFEGNIGSGKTSSLEYFSKKYEIPVFAEPVDKWRDVRGHNLFKLMYDDPKRWGFAFQTYAQLTMFQRHRLARQINSRVTLMERSIFSARYCFVENFYRNGKITAEEYVILDEWFNWVYNNEGITVDLIVYLKANPEVCYERIKKRSRNEENTISMDYLRVLHDLHEEWLSGKMFTLPAPVLTLDADLDREDMERLLRSKSKVILGDDYEQMSVG